MFMLIVMAGIEHASSQVCHSPRTPRAERPPGPRVVQHPAGAAAAAGASLPGDCLLHTARATHLPTWGALALLRAAWCKQLLDQHSPQLLEGRQMIATLSCQLQASLLMR